MIDSFNLEAVIFDMDGLLIDSEPLWQEAEIATFAEVGISLTQTDCLQTLGVRIDQVVEHWYSKSPWDNIPRSEVVERIESRVLELVGKRDCLKPGVHSILRFFGERDVPMAIASSSSLNLIETVVDRFELSEHIGIVHSAQLETKGKPDPAVYHTTAEKLKVPATNVLAFEDSPAGLAAAVSAGMKCVVIPDQHLPTPEEREMAALVLESLELFSERHLIDLSSEPSGSSVGNSGSVTAV